MRQFSLSHASMAVERRSQWNRSQVETVKLTFDDIALIDRLKDAQERRTGRSATRFGVVRQAIRELAERMLKDE